MFQFYFTRLPAFCKANVFIGVYISTSSSISRLPCKSTCHSVHDHGGAGPTWKALEPFVDPSKQVLWDPKKGLICSDFAQGTTGDCWLDATMAAIAYMDTSRLLGTMEDP